MLSSLTKNIRAIIPGRFDGGHTMTGTAAPAYLGNPANVDPEEAFVASLSSCHMLTFLAIACKQKFVLDRYEDEAVGHMEKNAQGKMAITRVELHPKITWSRRANADAGGAGQAASRGSRQLFHRELGDDRGHGGEVATHCRPGRGRNQESRKAGRDGYDANVAHCILVSLPVMRPASFPFLIHIQ